MRIERFFILTALLFCFGIGSWADNVISISSAEGAPDEEVSVSISLGNSASVSSMQVSILLDESLTLVSESGKLSSRCGSHSLAIGVKDNELNIVIYSVSMATMTGNSGEVVSFKLKLGNQPGNITLSPSNTLLTDANGVAIDHSVENGTISIVGAKAQFSQTELNFGKVAIHSSSTRNVRVTNNGNADLVITGVGFSDVNMFSTTSTFPLTVKPGYSSSIYVTCSPEEVGDVERTMTVYSNSSSAQNTIKLKAQPYAVNELRVQPASGISGEEVTISLTMNNMDPVSGYQVEFNMPNELQYVEGSFALSDRKQDHVSAASFVDGVLRIIAYSTTDKPFTGNEGEIGSFRVILAGHNNVYLNPSKAVLSATINNSTNNVISGYSGATISIKSPQIYVPITSIDFGNVLATETCEKTFQIYNKGSAPLIVNRIEFDDENLAIKETLPLTIPAGQNSIFTVVHNGESATEIDAVMRIFSNDPEQQLLEVQVTGVRYLYSYFDAEIPAVGKRSKFNVILSVNNNDPITGLQFDIVYPNNYYEPFDNNYSLGTRANGMTVTAIPINENTIRYFCYFLSGGAIAVGNGKVMTLQFRPITGEVPLGNYVVQFKNIKLGTSEMSDKYAGNDIDVTFTVQDNVVGDVNGDGDVDIADAVCIVNHVVGKSNTTFNEAAADANGDGDIDIADAVHIVNYVVGKISALAPCFEWNLPEPE